jgi:hypothetical protein
MWTDSVSNREAERLIQDHNPGVAGALMVRRGYRFPPLIKANDALVYRGLYNADSHPTIRTRDNTGLSCSSGPRVNARPSRREFSFRNRTI